MKNKIDFKKLLKFWECIMIILLCILFIVTIQISPFTVNSINSEEASPVLSRLGSRGGEVRQIQQKLKDLGFYKGTVDGIFGTQTQTAAKAFQRSVGITADGIVGSKTLLFLGLGGSSTASSSAFSSNDIYLLAKVITAEARGENYRGQVAVGAVVLNRVDHASFPDSVAGVIYQPGAFTAVRDSNWSQEPTAQSKKAAQEAINGYDPSGGSIYYFNPAKTNDQWIRTRPVVAVIGKHIFCK